jgi:hypothetical protein
MALEERTGDQLDFQLLISNYADVFAVLVQLMVASRTFLTSEKDKKKQKGPPLLSEDRAMEEFNFAATDMVEVLSKFAGEEAAHFRPLAGLMGAKCLPDLLGSVYNSLSIAKSRSQRALDQFLIQVVALKDATDQTEHVVKYFQDIMIERSRLISGKASTVRAEEATDVIKDFLANVVGTSLPHDVLEQASGLALMYDQANAPIPRLRAVLKEVQKAKPQSLYKIQSALGKDILVALNMLIIQLFLA